MSRGVLIKAGLAVLALLAPIKAALITAMVVTVIDLVSGLLAARKRGEKITSAGLKNTLVKIFVYQFVIILGYFIEKNLIGDLLPLTKILTGYIGITELLSVLENLEDITGLPILKVLIKKFSKTEL
jgi:phage-related holin